MLIQQFNFLTQITAPFVIFLALVSSSSPDMPRIGLGEHPRLFFTQSEIPALQAKATSTHAQIAQPILDFSSQSIGELPPLGSPTEGNEEIYRNHGNQIISLAFACVLGQDTGRCTLAKESLLRYAGWAEWGANGERGLGLAHMVMGNAIAYDWLYPQLNTTEREQVRQSLSRNTQKLYEASSADFYDESWKNWWRNSYVQNFYSNCNSALGMAALVLQGEDARAEQWLSHAKGQIQKFSILLKGIRDGTWHEGMGYQSYTLTFLLPFLVNLERIEGQNLFPDEYLQNYVYWRIYNRLPGQFYPALALGDYDNGWDNAYESQQLLRFIAGRYRNQHAEWMAQQLIQTGGRHSDQWSTPWYAFEYLYYDSSVAGQSPDWLPLSRTFWDQESLIWRSGWGNDALVFGLKSGAPGGRFAFENFVRQTTLWSPPCAEEACQLNVGHGHLDSNSFYLYKGGYWLAPEAAGVNKQATAFHNTLLIDGKGQYEPPGANFWSVPADFQASDAFIQINSTVPDFDYVVSNATRRYKNIGDIREMTRHVLYARPDYILMLDNIRADTPHNYEWISHFGSAFTIEGSWVRGSGGDDQLLGIAVVAPQDFQSTTGNDGQPFITLQPTTPTAHSRQIHLLYPTNSANWSTKPEIQLLDNRNNWSAVRVERQNGSGDNDLVLFNNGANSGTGYSFDGNLALITKNNQQQLQKLYLVEGSQLIDLSTNRTLVSGLRRNQSLEVVYKDDSVLLYGSLGGNVEIYAPAAQQVRFNGDSLGFSRSGDTIQVCLGECQ